MNVYVHRYISVDMHMYMYMYVDGCRHELTTLLQRKLSLKFLRLCSGYARKPIAGM